MKILKLNNGKTVLIDNEDYNYLNQYRWRESNHGYAMRYERCGNGKRRVILMHRKIMKASSGSQLDHINRNKLDNRKCNLRFCSTSQNMHNQESKIKSSSKYKGVIHRKNKKRWEAAIKIDGKTIYLGLYKTEIEAAQAYNRGAVKYYGNFAALNKKVG